MNKKNLLLVNAAIMGLFVAGGVANVHADAPSTKKECKKQGGEWKDGACHVEKASEGDDADQGGESACGGEGSCNS